MARCTQPRRCNGGHNKPQAQNMHPQSLSPVSTMLAAITLHPTSSQCNRPHHCHGQRNKPWAPNTVSPSHQPSAITNGNSTFPEVGSNNYRGRYNNNRWNSNNYFRVKGTPLPSRSLHCKSIALVAFIDFMAPVHPICRSLLTDANIDFGHPSVDC